MRLCIFCVCFVSFACPSVARQLPPHFPCPLHRHKGHFQAEHSCTLSAVVIINKCVCVHGWANLLLIQLFMISFQNVHNCIHTNMTDAGCKIQLHNWSTVIFSCPPPHSRSQLCARESSYVFVHLTVCHISLSVNGTLFLYCCSFRLERLEWPSQNGQCSALNTHNSCIHSFISHYSAVIYAYVKYIVLWSQFIIFVWLAQIHHSHSIDQCVRVQKCGK